MLRLPSPSPSPAAVVPHPFARILDRARHEPHAPALAGACEAVTYGELHAIACDAAARLERLGVPAGARTAVLGRKSPETIALVLACLLTARPVLLPSPELDAAATRALLERAGVDRALAAEPVPGAEVVRPARDVPAPGRAPRGRAPEAEDVALMLTTSGSTGLPKIVPISHRAILRFAAWAGARFGIGSGTRVLSYCGLNFDLSLLEVWTTLLYGGCAVLVEHEHATRPTALLDLVRRHEPHVIQGVPMLFALLADAADADGRAPAGVRHAILTGDATPMSLLARLPGLLGDARLWNVYGCTETNDSFIHAINVERELRRGTVPLGDPLPSVRALLVDDGRVVEGPGAGELWVSTPFQAAGYLGPRAPDDGFAGPPPGVDAHGFFRSRDLVRRDAAGDLFLEGRTDSQVKVRGVRVNLQAVEQALLADPAVAEAAVVAVDDGVAGRRLVAVLRRRPGTRVDTLALRRRCARDLGRIAVPGIIDIQDDALPKTTTGKVDRTAVRRERQRRAA